jgi:hypothetical protein
MLALAGAPALTHPLLLLVQEAGLKEAGQQILSLLLPEPVRNLETIILIKAIYKY